MNTKSISYRKKELKEAIEAGMAVSESVAPEELLALAVATDPLDYLNGVNLLAQQIGLGEDSFDLELYLMDNALFDYNAVEVAKETYMMDKVRVKRNKYKYENGLLADDEILALTLFLISDADIITEFNKYGKIEYYDISNLINHVAARLKFLIYCFSNKRYDILNTIMLYVKEHKTSDIKTCKIFSDIDMDDGGVIKYYKKMVDVKVFNPEYESEFNSRIVAKKEGDGCGSNIANQTRKFNECDGEEDDEDICREEKAPLVERDFEG